LKHLYNGKNTETRELVLPNPHPKQFEVIDALTDPAVKYVVMIAGRQCGKTHLAKSQAIMWAVNDPKCIIYWVSPTDAQMQSIYRDIISTIYPFNVIKSKKGGKGDTEIRFRNGSVILFRAGGSENSLRGTSGVNYLVLDEAAFLKQDTVESIIMPMMATSIKKVFCISTPKGKNWLYTWYNRASHNPKWRSFKFSSLDNPYVSKDFIQDQRETLAEAMFQQEIMADWIDKSSIFHNISELMCEDEQLEPIAGEVYYAGIDIGLENDATVLSIINSRGDLVRIHRYHRVNTNQLIKAIKGVNNIWKFKKILIENNNQGLPIYQVLKPDMPNLQDINTSSKNKPEMINDLIYLFNTKGMYVCKNDQLRMELEGFLMSQNDRGVIRFAAASNMSDDCVMSLAIARMCYKMHNRSSGHTGFYF